MFDFDELDALEAEAERATIEEKSQQTTGDVSENRWDQFVKKVRPRKSFVDAGASGSVVDASQPSVDASQPLVSTEGSNADSLSVEQQIQEALKKAVVRRRQEAGIQENPSAEEDKSYDWPNQHLGDWQGSNSAFTGHQEYSWPQLYGMQPSLVTQSDGHCTIGSSWAQPQSAAWRMGCLPHPPDSQLGAWHPWPRTSVSQPRPWASEPKSEPLNVPAPVDEAQIEDPGEGAIPELPAREETSAQEELGETPITPMPELPVPVPVSQPSPYDLRNNWRQQVAKRIAEKPVKVRKDRSRQKLYPEDYSIQRNNASAKKMEDEELELIGKSLLSMYARHQSEDACAQPVHGGG